MNTGYVEKLLIYIPQLQTLSTLFKIAQHVDFSALGSIVAFVALRQKHEYEIVSETINLFKAITLS